METIDVVWILHNSYELRRQSRKYDHIPHNVNERSCRITGTTGTQEELCILRGSYPRLVLILSQKSLPTVFWPLVLLRREIVSWEEIMRRHIIV